MQFQLKDHNHIKMLILRNECHQMVLWSHRYYNTKYFRKGKYCNDY